jgi:hypothetical protein
VSESISAEWIGRWSATYRQVHSSLPKVNLTELVALGE